MERSHKSIGVRVACWLRHHDNISLNLLAILVGLCSGFIGVGFRHLIIFVQNLFLHREVSLLETYDATDHTWGVWIIFIPALGGLFVGLMNHYFRADSTGHGVPEVMEAATFRRGIMRGRSIPIRAVATALTLGSGGSTGREGPVVAIGAAAGSFLAQIFKLRPDMVKILLACGATGGLAASFNTPIAGLLFSLELIILEFRTRSFIPLVISAVFGTMVSRTFLGDMPVFIVPEYFLVSNQELFVYLLLGVFSGFVAILFISTSHHVTSFFEKLAVPTFLKPAIGGLLVGAMALFLPQILGGGYHTVSAVLLGEVGLWVCLLLVFGKILAVSLTLGSGGSGGVFAPSLFIGAVLGGFIGAVFHQLFPEHTAGAGAYALVGMAALFSGVSRATLTAIIILFEMTLNYNIILPLMFSCVISDAIVWGLYKDSIYSKELKRKGIRFFQDLGPDVMAMHVVKEVMTSRVETVLDSDTVQSVWQKILSSGHQGFPVVNEQQRLVGIITASDIRRALGDNALESGVSEYTTARVVVTYPDEDLHTLMDKIYKRKLGHIPVVSRDDSKQLLGIITRSDLMKMGYGAV